MVRTLGLLLILALLATVPGSARCLVRCASPVSTPPCHHHAPAKQSPPTHACAAAMLPGETRSEAAPAVVMAAPVAAIATPVAAPPPSETLPFYQPVDSGAHTVLRV